MHTCGWFMGGLYISIVHSETLVAVCIQNQPITRKFETSMEFQPL